MRNNSNIFDYQLFIINIFVGLSKLLTHCCVGIAHAARITVLMAIIQQRTLQPTGAIQKDHITRQHAILLRTISKCNRSTARRWMGLMVLVRFALAAKRAEATARAGEKFLHWKMCHKIEWDRGTGEGMVVPALASDTSSGFWPVYRYVPVCLFYALIRCDGWRMGK